MSKIKKYVILLLLILGISCSISLYLPKIYIASSHLKINAPHHYIFNTLNNLSLQTDWNYLASLDTLFQISCSGNFRNTGASCDFSSKNYGAGVLRIIYSLASDTIAITEEQKSRKDKLFQYRIVRLDSTKSEIYVQAQSSSGFITNLWNFVHKRKLRKQLKQNLQNLNILVNDRFENNVYNGYKITEAAINKRYFISHRSKVLVKNIQEYYSKNISNLYQIALENGLVISGMPCGLFYNKNESYKEYDMAAALPTLSEFNIKDCESIIIEPRQAIIVEFKGENSSSGPAYNAITEYMLDHNIKNNSPIIEEYQTDPTSEPDPQKWATKIIYYILPK